MLNEGRALAKLADNIVVKAPLTVDGLKTCKALSEDGIKVNVMLCFSAAQAILAAKAGAAYISPFVGRLDDTGADGLQPIAEIAEIYNAYPASPPDVMVHSVTPVGPVNDSAKMGAAVATTPPAV